MARMKRKLRSDDNHVRKKKARTESSKRKICFSDDDESTVELPVRYIPQDDGKAGIIEKVTLKNFMCHSNLEFEFGPNTNLVTGRNGSGKSAVLNGIILALGGRSILTGRNTNTKGFIQNGKQEADISVTLKNVGTDAYNASAYGPRIIIERKINADGGSKYKLKGDRGKLVSTKHDELVNILDALNIQVDNPVSFLTQEASRSFLLSKDAKKKYSLFFKATLLEKLFEQYDEAQQKIEDSKITLKNKHETLPEVEKEVNKWEEKLKKLQALDEQEERIKALENELSWAIVKTAENREVICRNTKEKLAKTLEKETAQKEENERRYSNCLDVIKNLKEADNTAKADIRTMKGETDKLIQDINQLTNQIVTMSQYIRRLEGQLQQADCGIEHLEKDINDLRQKSEIDSAELRKSNEEKSNALQMELTNLQYLTNQINDKNEVISKEINELKSAIQNKSEEVNCYKYKLKNKKEFLDTMISSRGNQAYLYGDKMPFLIETIKASSSLFHVQPLGPIGLYLTVQDEKWIFAVECCLKGILSSFCCHDLHDKTELQNLMHQVYGHQRKPNIIVSEFLNRVHDVRSGKAVCDRYQTIFDAINCAEPNIMNCLIDQKRIESVLLIEGSSEAASLLMDSPPRNCTSAFTSIGDQIYPFPQYRYYACKGEREVKYLKQCYTVNDISAARSEVNSLEYKIMKAEEDIAFLHSKILEKQNLLEQHNRQVVENQKRRYEISQELAELNNSEDATAALNAQEEELKNQKLWREKLKGQIAEQKKEYKLKQDEKKKITAVRDAKAAQIMVKQHEIGRISDQLEKHQVEEVELDEKEKRLAEIIDADKKKLENAEKDWREAAEIAESYFQEALKVCDRIDTEKTPAVLENEIEQYRNVLSEERTSLDRDSINKNYVEKKQKFEYIRGEITRLENFNMRMQKMMNERWKKFKLIRKDTTLNIHYKFQANMKARNYVGRLIFCHDEKTLDIKANPRQTNEDIYKTNALSGGERSYVTIALMLALCSEANMPFHIFDEYDVFMDSVHQDTSMRIIMEMALLHNHQFIFLSPLHPPDVGDSAMIHKMPDPVRSSEKQVQCEEEEL